jgi:formylglycine-generating enzyme required for sulfatase activity
MKRLWFPILLLLLALPLFGARKALVIGNADYNDNPLRNPVNDADDIATALQKASYSVSKYANVNKDGFDAAISSFRQSIQKGDEVLFYFSGHGAQIDGVNYLIPVRENIDSAARCKSRGFKANELVDEFSAAEVAIIILDACRDNPFLGYKSSGSKGLVAMQGIPGSQFIIYATAEGRIANDGSGRNSPFTESLARHIATSTKSIENMMKDVTNEVAAKTNESQIPWTAGNLRRDFYFNASVAPIVEDKPKPKPEIETVWLYGTLFVETNQAGDLYLNGEKQQTLSAGQGANIRLVTGDYTVEMRSGSETKNQRVSVNKDQTSNLKFSFEAKAQTTTTITPSSTQTQQTSTPANMVFVEGGTFQMGSNDGESDEKPVHQVTVSSFYIGKYEVTQKEWQEVMGSNPSNWKGDKLPVEQVSWYDAVEYCNQRSRKEGLTSCYTIDKTSKDPNNTNQNDSSKWKVSVNWSANGYRLPTEAEWEYAARGGVKSKGYKYAGSNDIGSVAWYDGNCDDITHEVGTKVANELGIFDMTGNILEWCWDWYDAGYYAKSSGSNPTGAASGENRVLRGGSWFINCGGGYCRVTSRISSWPSYRFSFHFGFRIVRSIS